MSGALAGGFSPFPYNVRKFVAIEGNGARYRVLAEGGVCKEVIAVNADEALRLSEVARPLRIQRVEAGTELLIERGQFE